MKKITNYINRPESIITKKENLEHLYSFKDFPVFFGCVETPKSNDMVADMDWSIDPETGVVQLTKLIPLDILYQEQHVDGCGPTWQQYYKDFADYISKQKPETILEIGGGMGALADKAIENLPNSTWVIVEPNPTHLGSENIKVISDFFDENFEYENKVDAVVFSQVMEHAYDPRSFLTAISKFIKPGGRLIFAYPNLQLWLSRKYTNALNFEHTVLLTDHHIDYLLPHHGFSVIDKREYKDHSFFYTVERSDGIELPEKLENKYSEYKNIFLDFIKYHELMAEELNDRLANSDNPTYLFGAHIFSTYLLSFGLKTGKIISLLDNSPTKQGKRLYGTNLMVESPKILAGKGPVNVILKAGIYNEEIKKDILENINSEVVFW